MMSKRTGLWVGLLGAAIVAALFIAWRIYSSRQKTEPDMDAAIAHNIRGVALMDQYEYKQAEPEFAQATKLAPDWLPGHINLGIALLNQADPEPIDLAIKEFEFVLSREPDNLHAHYCLGFILTYHRQFTDAIPHFERVTQLDPNDAGGWYQLGFVLSQAMQMTPGDAALG